jgi:hypothetical protein
MTKYDLFIKIEKIKHRVILYLKYALYTNGHGFSKKICSLIDNGGGKKVWKNLKS